MLPSSSNSYIASFLAVWLMLYSEKNPEPISIKDLLTGITQLHFCFTSLVKKKINQPFFFF